MPCWQVLRFLPGEGVRLYGLTLFSAGIRLSGPIQLLGIPTRGFHPRAVLPSFNGESTGRPHSSSPASASPSSFSSSATVGGSLVRSLAIRSYASSETSL